MILGVANEAELLKWQGQLKEKGVQTATFVEPDMGDQATAMAVHPCTDRKLFKKLRLL